MGRPPKPTKLKILTGNPGRRPINQREPKPRPMAPRCPIWLDLEAKREWRRVSVELDRIGLLTIVDRAALAGYCQAWSRWRQAEMDLSEHGLTMTVVTRGGTYERPRPEVEIAQKNLRMVKAFCSEFGLSPSARAKMTIPEPAEDDDGLDAARG